MFIFKQSLSDRSVLRKGAELRPNWPRIRKLLPTKNSSKMATSVKVADGFSQNKLCCIQHIEFFILRVHKTFQIV